VRIPAIKATKKENPLPSKIYLLKIYFTTSDTVGIPFNAAAIHARTTTWLPRATPILIEEAEVKGVEVC
jgi:hypothetical protein